jgi:hypothetical protein
MVAIAADASPSQGESEPEQKQKQKQRPTSALQPNTMSSAAFTHYTHTTQPRDEEKDERNANGKYSVRTAREQEE